MFFNPVILRKPVLVTVDIFYYMPDYTHLVQEFIWQMEDNVPEMERVRKYLRHWKEEIDVVLKEIKIGYGSSSGYKRVEFNGLI
jgi:uncharacterized protein Usg